MEDKEAALAAILELGKRCPAVSDAVGNDPLDLCVIAYEVVWRSIEVLHHLVREHPVHQEEAHA